jgi:hypothetical protein
VVKRILASSIPVFMLGTALFLPGTALAGVLKFDFPATTKDGNTPIRVEVSSRTNKQGNVTVCNYYDEKTGAFLGHVQGSTSGERYGAEGAEQFCKDNIPQSAPSQ